MRKTLIIDDTADGKELVRLCVKIAWPEAEVVFYDVSHGCPGHANGLGQFELVLIDQDLGDGPDSGLAWVEHISALPDAPLLVVLGTEDAEISAVRSRSAGADEFVSKRGITPEHLARSVQAAQRRRAMFEDSTGLETQDSIDPIGSELTLELSSAPPTPTQATDYLADIPDPLEALSVPLNTARGANAPQPQSPDKHGAGPSGNEIADAQPVPLGTERRKRRSATDEMYTIRLNRPVIEMADQEVSEDTGALFRVPGYKLVRRVGRGGTSTAWLADRSEDELRVILKILRLDRHESRRNLDAFLREHEIISQLQHPNVARIYERGTSGEFAFIAMEYLSGGDLKQKIADVLSMEACLDVLRGMAAGLSAAHEQGIVHRDIKPSNVLFRGNGDVALIDFGIAKVVSEDNTKTLPFTVKGTPFYMSPEQIQGFQVDVRSDLYSLGVVFHEMLTGRKPFAQRGLHDLIMAHVNEPPPSLPAHLSKLQPLVDGLLAKGPDERFQDVAELLRGLEIIVPGEGSRRTAVRVA